MMTLQEQKLEEIKARLNRRFERLANAQLKLKNKQEARKLRETKSLEEIEKGGYFNRTITLNRKDTKALKGPIVYMWFKNGVLQYVGSATSAARCFSSGHHQWKLITECDKVVIIPCETREEAYELEKHLIRVEKPLRNRARPQG